MAQLIQPFKVWLVMRGILWGGNINGGAKMVVRGVSGLCDGRFNKLSSVKYFSNIFNLACVLTIYRGKLVNPCLCSIVNAYAVN